MLQMHLLQKLQLKKRQTNEIRDERERESDREREREREPSNNLEGYIERNADVVVVVAKRERERLERA